MTLDIGDEPGYGYDIIHLFIFKMSQFYDKRIKGFNRNIKQAKQAWSMHDHLSFCFIWFQSYSYVICKPCLHTFSHLVLYKKKMLEIIVISIN